MAPMFPGVLTKHLNNEKKVLFVWGGDDFKIRIDGALKETY